MDSFLGAGHSYRQKPPMVRGLDGIALQAQHALRYVDQTDLVVYNAGEKDLTGGLKMGERVIYKMIPMQGRKDRGGGG